MTALKRVLKNEVGNKHFFVNNNRGKPIIENVKEFQTTF